MSKAAQNYIDGFTRGEDFTAPAKDVFVDGRPDPKALEILGDALNNSGPNVRENIVHLLVDMALRTDPLTPQGAEVLRHKQILELLSNAGLSKTDLGREAAMEALRKLATQPDLAQFEREYTNALGEEPTGEAFLLIAKAKTNRAMEMIERLIKLPKWRDMEEAKIAHAALGSTDDEDKFLTIAAAAEIQGGQSFVRAIGTLGLIGTQRTLRVVGGYLRTPQTIQFPVHVPGAIGVRAIRLNVLEALLYNFPDHPELYPNNINRDDDYRSAEQFCTERLGVTYSQPPPPFLTYGNVPVPIE
jgi:hypothetical protein